ncbi:MAG: hypothetical protein WC959_09330 [Kiritimatiellales bacterium]
MTKKKQWKKTSPVKGKQSVKKNIRFHIYSVLMLLLAAALPVSGIAIHIAAGKAGPKWLNTNVGLRFVLINPFTATVHLYGLTIQNPEDYSSGPAMKFGHLRAHFAVTSFLADTIVVKKIYSFRPEITYEKSLWSSNLSALQDNLKQSIKESGKTGAVSKRIIIRNVVLDQAAVHVTTRSTDSHLVLPRRTITFQDIGGSDYKTPVEAAASIFTSIGNAATDAASSAGQSAKDAAGTIKKEIGNFFSGE